MNRKRKESECFYDYRFKQEVEGDDLKKSAVRLFYSGGGVPYVRVKLLAKQ